jgi:hypothetical protein
VVPARLGAALCGLSQLTELQRWLCLSQRYAACGAAAELRPSYDSIATSCSKVTLCNRLASECKGSGSSPPIKYMGMGSHWQSKIASHCERVQISLYEWGWAACCGSVCPLLVCMA